MKSPLAAAESAVTSHDTHDALRIVEAAMVLGGLPGVMSAEARELAARRLRELSAHHPRFAEIFAAVVTHLESYS